VRGIFVFCLAIFALGAPAHSASAQTQKLVYTVHHSRYGTIGTYTNTVEKAGDNTIVKTEAHVAVSLLGVSFYRQDASREERWNGDRLVSFHGVTTVNGHSLELNGMAEGDRFVLKSPEEEIAAPANVRLANPWSALVLRGDVMITPDRGRMENVQIKAAETATLSLGKGRVRARRYEIDRLDGQKRYEVFLDDRGTVVMFSSFSPDGTTTSFTLEG
jgi:uncharacterized protein DUF6134